MMARTEGLMLPSLSEHEDLTALHLAVAYRHTDCIQMLVDEGCDLAARTTLGWTPMFFACAKSLRDRKKKKKKKKQQRGSTSSLTSPTSPTASPAKPSNDAATEAGTGGAAPVAAGTTASRMSWGILKRATNSQADFALTEVLEEVSVMSQDTALVK